MPAGKLAPHYGSHRPVHVSYGKSRLDPLAVLYGGAARVHEDGVVQGFLETVVLVHTAVGSPVPGHLGAKQDSAEIYAPRLPVLHGLSRLEPVGPPYHLVHGAKTHLRHYLAKLRCDETHEVHHVGGVSREFFPKLGILGRHPDGTGVEVAHPHHYAPENYQRGGGKAELLGPQQGGHGDVPPRLHLPVGFENHPASKVVLQEGLVGLRYSQFPGKSRVLYAALGRSARAPGRSAYQYHVRVTLGHARGDGSHSRLGDELYVYPRMAVRVLEVVDELRQVLYRVYVVVRGRRYEAHAGSREPHLGYPRVDLLSRKLSAFAGLGSLGYLYLYLVGIDQVLARNAEAARGHLLYGASAKVPVGVGREPVGILPALPRVALGPYAVHGHGQALVGLPAYRAVGHGPRLEPPAYAFDRFDLFERDGALGEPKLHQSAQGEVLLLLVVGEPRVLPELLVASRPARVVEGVDRAGMVHVTLPVGTPPVDPSCVEGVGPDLSFRKRPGVPGRGLGGYHVDSHSPYSRNGPREVLLDELLGETQRLEYLRPVVALHRGDADFRHYLHYALHETLHVARHGVAVGEAREHSLAYHAVQGLVGHVGAHGARPVAYEKPHVVNFPGFARLDHYGRAHPVSVPYQVMVKSRDGEKRGNGSVPGVEIPVGEDQYVRSLFYLPVGAGEDFRKRGFEPFSPLLRVEERGHHGGAEFLSPKAL